MENLKHFSIKVSDRAQGVFFRSFIKENANQLGKILSLVIISLLTMCNNNTERAGLVIDESLLKEAVKKGFKANNNQLLSKQDSCLFVHFLDYWNVPKQPLLRTFESLNIYNYRFYFDFPGAVIKDLRKDEYVFYGNFDVHYLKFRKDKSDLLKIVPFQNPSLSKIVNDHLGLKSELSDWDITKSLRAFIYELYYSNQIDGIPTHAFEILEYHLFLKEFPKHAKLLPSLSNENCFIFNSKYLGVIIFKWTMQNEMILIEEFLIPFGYHHLRGDHTLPFDAPPCFTDEALDRK